MLYSRLALLGLVAAALAAGETTTAIDPAWLIDATALEHEIKFATIAVLTGGKRIDVAVVIGGDRRRGSVIVADDQRLGVRADGSELVLPWTAWTSADPGCLAEIARGTIAGIDGRRLVRYLMARKRPAEAERELARVLAAEPGLNDDPEVVALRDLVRPKKAPTKAKEKRLAAPSVNVDATTADVLRKLGRSHLMVGLVSAPGDSFVAETRGQGVLWDMRYQYVCGGANTDSNWKTWNQPAGAFIAMYLRASGEAGVIPVLTYYQMLQSLPAAGTGGESAVVRANSRDAGCMRAYFDDFALLMRECGAFAKPVIVHIEPDLWGYMQLGSEWAPNRPDEIAMSIASSGHADAQGRPDTAVGFGQCLIAIRDRLAPNALLACHVSKWGTPDIAATATWCTSTGPWDLVFFDVSDRDAGWKLANDYQAAGAWWSDADFAGFRAWIGQVRARVGLPLMAWQVPVGNTIMATCDDTPGHYQDNRAQHWFEDFPANRNLTAWAEAGLIGICFGGGAGGCTDPRDGAGDGITNPAPKPGNTGEKSVVADDDGGYLRTRVGAYFRKGALRLRSGRDEAKGEAKAKGVPAKPTDEKDGAPAP